MMYSHLWLRGYVSVSHGRKYEGLKFQLVEYHDKKGERQRCMQIAVNA